MQQETEEETKTEMSDTEPPATRAGADEPTEDDISDSVSESELRELLTVPAHSSRRHSAPVTFPTPVARTIIRRESLPAQPPRRLHTETLLHLQRAGGGSHQVSMSSLASLRVPEEYEGESDVSAENLLPDPSITSITAGGTASPLSNWTPTPNLGSGSSVGSLASISTPDLSPSPPPAWSSRVPSTSVAEGLRLERQRTFPVTQPGDASRVRYMSLPVSSPVLPVPQEAPSSTAEDPVPSVPPAVPSSARNPACRPGEPSCNTPPIISPPSAPTIPNSRVDTVAQLRAFQSVLGERVNTHYRRQMGRRRGGDPCRAPLIEKENRAPPVGVQRGGPGRRSVGNISELLRRRGSVPVKLGCAQEAHVLARNSSFTEGEAKVVSGGVRCFEFQ